MTTDFRILGPLEVIVNGCSIAVPGRNVRGLLGALLLDAGNQVSEEQLFELAWGPSGGSTAALRTAACRLRSWLLEHSNLANVLHHTGSGYLLDLQPETLDSLRFRNYMVGASRYTDCVAKFSELQNAMNQWRGNVLAGASEFITNSPSARFLERERIECACDLADVALSAGRPMDALKVVETLVSRLPYNEVLLARHIKLLGACGLRAEGLLRFLQIREQFAEDLGVEPSGLLMDEYLALL